MTHQSTARLAKDPSREHERPEYRILCGRVVNGRPSCGGELGHLVRIVARESFDVWVASFPPGWVETDGVWHLTTYARRRRKHLTRRATDPDADPHERSEAAARVAQGTYGKNRRPLHVIDLSPEVRRATPDLPAVLRSHAARGTQLPAAARCPKCGHVNRLGTALIEIARERWQGEQR